MKITVKVIRMAGKHFTYRPGAFFGIFAQITQPKSSELRSQGVSPTEELSREHAMLTRLLLAIDNMANLAIEDMNTDISPINQAAQMIKRVVIDYHSKFEEEHIYPQFEDNDLLSSLTEVFEDQHDQTERMNEALLELTRSGKLKDESDLDELLILCIGMKDMLTAHAAWEETILFPAMYDLLPQSYMDDLKRKQEEEEKKLVGDRGPVVLYEELGRIEEACGTHDLDAFTFQ